RHCKSCERPVRRLSVASQALVTHATLRCGRRILLHRVMRDGSRPQRKLWAFFFPGVIGGESGIRTHGTRLTYTRFPSVRLKPLGHLSVRDAFYPAQKESPPRGRAFARCRTNYVLTGTGCSCQMLFLRVSGMRKRPSTKHT